VPFIYYGEEIGMMGGKPDENIRRPMQWTPDGGFTSGEPWNAYADDHTMRNVAQQEADPNSILSHDRALIRLRNGHEALRVGEWHLVESGHDAVYASLRSTAKEQILVLANLGSKPVSDYGLILESGSLAPGVRPVQLMGQADQLVTPAVTARGGFTDYRPVATLPPRSSYFIQFVP
jgi:glycosidase